MEEKKQPFKALLEYWEKTGIKKPKKKLHLFQEELLTFINNAETHHHILLTAYNVPDGIGDFVNLLDYYAWIKDIFKPMQNVHIHAVGVVSASKEIVAKKVLPDGFDIQNKLAIIHIGNMQNTTLTLDLKEIIIVKCDTEKFINEIDFPQLSTIFENCTELQAIFNSADLLLNLATPFEAIQNLFLKYINPSACLIRSILEYGPQQPLGPHLKQNNHEYTELSMGFDRDEVGIKFNEDIYSERGADQFKKANKLLKLNNSQLLKQILNNSEPTQEDALNYFTNHHFGMGYLQNEEHTCNFIKLLVATSQDKVIDAIIDTGKFKIEQIKEYLVKYNIHKVILYDNTGKEIIAHNISQDSEKSIRLFTYAGSTNHDTNIFFTISDVAGGSGDKSLSNVIACGAFPFIGSLGHKYETTARLIKYIEQIPNLNNSEPLVAYLSAMAERKVNSDKLCSYADLFYPSIKAAWFLASAHIYQHKNAKPYFIEVVYNYLLFRLFEKQIYTDVIISGMESIYRNINLNTVNICKQNLLFLAIDCNNLNAVTKLAKLHTNLDIKTKKLLLTPLQYSLCRKQEEIAMALMRAGANPDKVFLSVPNALAYAIQENLSDNIINEIIKYMNKFIFFKESQMNLVLKYIIQNQQLKNSFINKSVDTKNLCLYYAIKTNDLELAALALESGAYIDLHDVNTLRREYLEMGGNTLLHLACKTDNAQLVDRLLEANPNIFIFDITNRAGQTAISLTSNPDISELLQEKSYCKYFQQKTGFKPFAISYDPTSSKQEATIKFHTADAAWQTWKRLRAFNISVPRPKPIDGTTDQIIIVPKELFDAYMQENIIQIIKPNDYAIKLSEMDLLKAINNVILCDYFKKQLLGENCLELIFSNNQVAVKVHKILTHFGIEAYYHAHDSTIEISPIYNNDVFDSFQLMLKYKQLLHSLKEISNIHNIDIEISDIDVIMNVKNEEDAVKLWVALTNNHILCEPPEEGIAQLSLLKETILAFLDQTLVLEPLNDILKEVLKDKNRQKLAHLFDDNIALTAYGTEGLIVTFTSDNRAEQATDILHDKSDGNILCQRYGNTLLLRDEQDLGNLMDVLKTLEPIPEKQANPTITGRRL